MIALIDDLKGAFVMFAVIMMYILIAIASCAIVRNFFSELAYKWFRNKPTDYYGITLTEIFSVVIYLGLLILSALNVADKGDFYVLIFLALWIGPVIIRFLAAIFT